MLDFLPPHKRKIAIAYLAYMPIWIGIIGYLMFSKAFATWGDVGMMTLGIGLYAPCLILVSLLGMNPLAAFPIMMGSCAVLMPVASVRFIGTRKYDLRAALGLALGGIPAVLLAAYVVRQLPLDWLRWLVVIIVLYAAALMLLSARTRAPAAAADSSQLEGETRS